MWSVRVLGRVWPSPLPATWCLPSSTGTPAASSRLKTEPTASGRPPRSTCTTSLPRALLTPSCGPCWTGRYSRGVGEIFCWALDLSPRSATYAFSSAINRRNNSCVDQQFCACHCSKHSSVFGGRIRGSWVNFWRFTFLVIAVSRLELKMILIFTELMWFVKKDLAHRSERKMRVTEPRPVFFRKRWPAALWTAGRNTWRLTRVTGTSGSSSALPTRGRPARRCCHWREAQETRKTTFSLLTWVDKQTKMYSS